jgi:L-ascorbate metabolism protein UlaG (beta-lactamase superfamily)
MMDVYVTHISTACVLLEIGQTRILTDPVFDTGVEEHQVAPLSHPHHADNLDESDRTVLKEAREVMAPLEELDHLPGQRATGLRPWSKTTVFGRGDVQITVTATPALHGPRWVPNANPTQNSA